MLQGLKLSMSWFRYSFAVPVRGSPWGTEGSGLKAFMIRCKGRQICRGSHGPSTLHLTVIFPDAALSVPPAGPAAVDVLKVPAPVPRAGVTGLVTVGTVRGARPALRYIQVGSVSVHMAARAYR